MIAIHGRMYVVGAIASPTLTVGAYTTDLVVGDTIMLYSNVGKPTGAAVIKTIVSVPIPPGINPNAVDTVFGNQFGGYAWWKVRPPHWASHSAFSLRLWCWLLYLQLLIVCTSPSAPLDQQPPTQVLDAVVPAPA